MPCSECPHCRAAAARSRLHLPGRPVNGGPQQSNLPFYAAFGQVYALARQSSPQPMAAIRAANPGLTASQCSTYLKRARQLGYVTGVGSPIPAAEPVAEPAVTPERSTSTRGRPSRGRRGRGRAAGPSTAAETIRKLNARFEDVDGVLGKWKLNRTRVTPTIAVRDLPGVPDGDAPAVLDWLVAEELAEWDQWRESVLVL